MTRSLLRSAIGLALTSAILTILMFRLLAPLAAVFELSVCAGLISVLFVSTVSLTEPLSKTEMLQYIKERYSRFRYLPYIILVTGIILVFLNIKLVLKMPAQEIEKDVRQVMWNLRQLDLLGQIIILLTGSLGVVVLFKWRQKGE